MPPPNAARNARIRAVTERAKRPRRVLISFIDGQAISHSAHRVNQLLLKRFINLAPQIANVNIHYVGLVEVFIAPNVLSDLRTGQDASWFTQQTLEYRKFFQSQGNDVSTPSHLVRAGIHAQVR